MKPSARSFFRLLLIFAVVCGALPAWAVPMPAAMQSTAKAVASGAASVGAFPAPEEKVALDSPRASLAEFRKLVRTQDYAGAERYLDLSRVDQADGAQLAEHLKEVLARHLWVDLDKVSPASHGNTEDGLPPDEDQLGSVPGANGELEPVFLVRKPLKGGAQWLFSAATVAQIDGWYDHLGNIWLVERMPRALLRMGPHHIRRWQWLGLALLVVGGWCIGFVITRLARVVIRRVLSEQRADAIRKIRGATTLALAVGFCEACLPWLGLYEPGEVLVQRWLAAGLLLALFWALWRTVELSQRTVGKSRWARESVTAHSLLLLGARLAKFAVAAVAFIAVLAELGYHATTLITGLGIGGIALALAAQKTVENLFGAFSLAIDQPFRQGDTIQVDTITGTVEAIGLRSTRIRTADRTLISIPNGKLADMRVETINRQDQLRFYAVLGRAHGASGQLMAALHAVEALLRQTDGVAASSIGVHFIALTDSAVNLEIAAMFDTTDGERFQSARQALLLGIVDAIERTGNSLAHATHRVEAYELPAVDQEPKSGNRLQREISRHGS